MYFSRHEYILYIHFFLKNLSFLCSFFFMWGPRWNLWCFANSWDHCFLHRSEQPSRKGGCSSYAQWYFGRCHYYSWWQTYPNWIWHVQAAGQASFLEKQRIRQMRKKIEQKMKRKKRRWWFKLKHVKTAMFTCSSNPPTLCSCWIHIGSWWHCSVGSTKALWLFGFWKKRFVHWVLFVFTFCAVYLDSMFQGEAWGGWYGNSGGYHFQHHAEHLSCNCGFSVYEIKKR